MNYEEMTSKKTTMGNSAHKAMVKKIEQDETKGGSRRAKSALMNMRKHLKSPEGKKEAASENARRARRPAFVKELYGL